MTQEQRCQNRDDGDDDKKFDQGKSANATAADAAWHFYFRLEVAHMVCRAAANRELG